MSKARIIFKGGAGSGNFGHAGRPGKRGGSASGSGGRGGGGGGSGITPAQMVEKLNAGLKPTSIRRPVKAKGNKISTGKSNYRRVNKFLSEQGYKRTTQDEVRKKVVRFNYQNEAGHVVSLLSNEDSSLMTIEIN